MEYYNITADSYNLQYQEEQTRKYKAAIDALRISRKEYILDVGCGTGLFIKETAKMGDLIVGVDVSRRMIELANRECKNLKNVFLICGDADHLSIREKIIDKVFSFTLIQNMPDPRRTIREILRVTKADSEVILSANKKSFTRNEIQKIVKEENMVITHFISDKEVKDYLAICTKGFQEDIKNIQKGVVQ